MRVSVTYIQNDAFDIGMCTSRNDEIYFEITTTGDVLHVRATKCKTSTEILLNFTVFRMVFRSTWYKVMH